MKKLAGRLNRVSPSLTVAIDSKAKALKAEGKDVIGLAAGEPDFDTPDYIKAAAIESINDGKTKYTPPAGILAVKESICKKFKNENNLTYTPSQIVISSGAKHCISNILTALIEEGDEVIIPAPFWVTYPELVKLYGGTPVIVSAGIENEFKITPEQLKAAVTDKTKMVVLNSPVNPTGAVYTEEELKAFADVIVENDLYCMSDEIYEHLIYDSYKHVSIASFNKEIYDRTIVINGVSKAFAMTGWRIGYIGASEEIAKAISKVQGQATHHPANASQFAAKAALDGSLESVEMMRTAFVERRNWLIEALGNIEGVQVCMPHGAFYAFPNLSSYIGKSFEGTVMESSIDLCAFLLDQELLALVPGDAFGAPGCVRLSYATDLKTIETAVDRLKSGLSKLV
ncbi:MAG: pyridoxal phosphate-dependent aminotransferase [Fibrobacterales bacterium]